MSATLPTSRSPVVREPSPLPPLRNGDHLAREEFHRRYEAMGEGVRAELIEGVVYLHHAPDTPSPVSLDFHATPHIDLGGWVFYYCLKTPGLLRGADGSVLLDGGNEPQPDVLLGIPESVGGRTRVVRRGAKQYVGSAPELVAEVAASTAAIDLHAKLRAYERNGVAEYLVVLTEERPPEVRWMALEFGRLAPLPRDPADGLLKSRAFPGLWLDPDALLAGDLPRLVAAVDRGYATAEHAAFVARLAAAAPTRDVPT